MMSVEKMSITPGEILKEEFLIPLKWTEKDLAHRMKCDVKIINDLINNKTRVSNTMAVKLGFIFKTGPELWLNLQKAVDLYKEQINEHLPISA